MCGVGQAAWEPSIDSNCTILNWTSLEVLSFEPETLGFETRPARTRTAGRVYACVRAPWLRYTVVRWPPCRVHAKTEAPNYTGTYSCNLYVLNMYGLSRAVRAHG